MLDFYSIKLWSEPLCFFNQVQEDFLLPTLQKCHKRLGTSKVDIATKAGPVIHCKWLKMNYIHTNYLIKKYVIRFSWAWVFTFIICKSSNNVEFTEKRCINHKILTLDKWKNLQCNWYVGYFKLGFDFAFFILITKHMWSKCFGPKSRRHKSKILK